MEKKLHDETQLKMTKIKQTEELKSKKNCNSKFIFLCILTQ